MNKEEIQERPYENGVSCANAGMSIHANPFRNTPPGDGEAYHQWIAGWRSAQGQDEAENES